MLHRAPRGAVARPQPSPPWRGVRAAAAPAVRIASTRVQRQSSKAAHVPLEQFLRSRAGPYGPADAHQLQSLCQQLFLGWSVRDNHGQLVGRVKQVDLLAPYTDDDEGDPEASSTGQVVLYTQLPSIIDTPKGTWGGIQVHRIPVAPDLIPSVDANSKTLLATLPQGFLDLGRRQFIVEYLSAALLPYSQDMPARNAPIPATMSTDMVYMPALQDPSSEVRIMPSRAILEAAGREDLAGLIREAGGHAAVAAALGWASARRPHGYWDDLENLEAELAAFLDTAWLELHDESGQSTYFYNQISGEVTLHPPIQPDGSRSDRQPSDASRVMPTTQQMIAAGRTDLLHAVRMYGGVAAVAELLKRTTARTRRSLQPLMTDDNSLRQEVCDLAAELGMPEGRLPTCQQMLNAGRLDLVRVIRGKGGWAHVASQLGLKAQRSGRKQLYGRDAQLSAACSLIEFMLQQLPSSFTDDSGSSHVQHSRTATSDRQVLHMTAPTAVHSPSPSPSALRSPAAPPDATDIMNGVTSTPKDASGSDRSDAVCTGYANQIVPGPRRQQDRTPTPSPVLRGHTNSVTSQLEQRLGALRARLKHACCLTVKASATVEQGKEAVPLPRWLQGPEGVSLPSLYALKHAGRWDLYTAIQTHGKTTLEGWCGIPELRASLQPLPRSKSSSPARQSDAVLQAVETLLIELASTSDSEQSRDSPSPSPPPSQPAPVSTSNAPSSPAALAEPAMKSPTAGTAEVQAAHVPATSARASPPPARRSPSPAPAASSNSRLSSSEVGNSSCSSTQSTPLAARPKTTSKAAQSTQLTAVSSLDVKGSEVGRVDVRNFKAAHVCKALQGQGLDVSSYQVRTALLRLVEQGKVGKLAGTTGRYTLVVPEHSQG